MRRFVALAWGLAACGQSVPPRPPAPAPGPPSPAAGTPLPHAPFAVVPAELGDDRVLDRIPHRAMVKRWSVAWLAQNGEPFGQGAAEVDRSRQTLPVIGEHGKKIRVVVDDDHARYAAWIARDDAWSTALVSMAISDGVTVEPGVALQVTGKKVTVVDDMLTAVGIAEPRAVGEVWLMSASAKPRDYDAYVRLPGGVDVHARPDGASPVIATVTADELVVGKLGVTGAFTEVEAQRPHVRARGFVETSKVLAFTGDFLTSGTGTGHGFGMSHANKLEVPAGACLYDRADGDVIGVTLEAQTRLGGRLGDDGWAMVYIDSPWRVTSMYLKNIGTDPSAPVWDSCTEPAHRR